METSDRPADIQPSAPVVDTATTGDEAYLRRLAMSSGAARATALADTNVPPIPEPALAPPPVAETGEEAYLRRVAMSSRGLGSHAPPPLPPQSVSPPPMMDTVAHPPPPPSTMGMMMANLPPPPPPDFSIPSDVLPSVEGQLQVDPSQQLDFQRKLRETQAKAAAIAARFKQQEQGGTAPPPPPDTSERVKEDK